MAPLVHVARVFISVRLTPVLDEDLSVFSEFLAKSNTFTLLQFQSGGVGEGDCDKDDDCKDGLKCGQGSGNDNNCQRDFGWGHAAHDCCYKEH